MKTHRFVYLITDIVNTIKRIMTSGCLNQAYRGCAWVKGAEMQYRADPQTGDKLSVLGFGCMRFARKGRRIDVDKAQSLVCRAVEAGVNYFDTAYVYGGSEETLGTIFARNPTLRDRIFLATKLPHRQVKTFADLDRIFDEQLTRLGTDHIDYYLIHNLPDVDSWQRVVDLGIEPWLEEQKTKGRIRRVGFSFHGTLASFEALLDVYDWNFCQIQYNYSDENFQAGVTGLRKAHEKGLAVMIMEPLLGGRLANGLPRQATEALQRAAGGRTLASWGLRWVFNQPEPTVVLSGMNASDQLEDNITTASQSAVGMLSDEEQAALMDAHEVLRAAHKVPCTGCNYCMPCPQGVNIPGCFSAYNARYVAGFSRSMMQYFTSTSASDPDKYTGPRKCVRCGACEAKCPQHIPIPDSLVEVRKHMEPFYFKALAHIVRMFHG